MKCIKENNEAFSIFCPEFTRFGSFIIGYKNQGETILIVIEVDENPVFCILVDSYYHKDINIVEKILEEKKIKGIDIICWTHPHKRSF